jgi:hypothetical protein
MARSGFLTYATMRNLAKSDSIKSVATKEKLPIHTYQLDVTDYKSLSIGLLELIYISFLRLLTRCLKKEIL